jgi:ribosomal protein S18 acetylase RimI-like enzyme
MADFEFRPVAPRDYSYCWSIYRDAVQPLALELKEWNEEKQHKLVDEALTGAGASILLENREAAGWLHVDETRLEIHLAHLYIEPQARNHGLGSKFMRWMNERARRKNKDFTVDVLKNNRAKVLAERLGFRVVGTHGNYLRMRLQA